MAQSIHLPSQTYSIGPLVADITAPARKTGATFTMTRADAGGWPAGDVFTWKISERQRGGALTFLTGGTEPGGTVTGKDGTVNPPFQVSVNWAADKDRDAIRVEMDVLQPFTSTIDVGFF